MRSVMKMTESTRVPYDSLEEEAKKKYLEKITKFLLSFCDHHELMNVIRDLGELNSRKIKKTRIVNSVSSRHFSTPMSMSVQPQNAHERQVQKKMRKISENMKKFDLNKMDGFCILSPHEVVHILQFLNVNVEMVSNQFECFGYFKNDPSRFIWFLFPSLSLLHKHGTSNNMKINNIVRKIKHFKTNFVTLYKFKNEKFNFKSLELQDPSSDIGIHPNEIDSFFINNSFKKLERIHLNGFISFPGDVNWMLNKLKSIEFGGNSFNGQIKTNFFKTNNICDLIKVKLYNVSFTNCNEWNEFKSLKTLVLRKCNVEDSFFNNNRKMFEKLEALEIENCKTLKYYNIGAKKFQLKKLKISQKDTVEEFAFNEIFFRDNSYECLSNIELYGLNNTSGKSWSTMKKLVRIKIEDCPKFGDFFFREQSFENLKYLFLKNNESLCGIKWKAMPVIKSLRVEECVKLCDEIFQNEKSFFELKVLVLSRCNVTGMNYTDMPKLERLIIWRNKKFVDDFFQNGKFSFLWYCSVSECPLIRGVKWNEVPNLEVLYFNELKNFEDVFFQEHPLKKIYRVVIDRLPKITMKNWIVDYRTREVLSKNMITHGKNLFVSLKSFLDQCATSSSIIKFDLMANFVIRRSDGVKKNPFKVLQQFEYCVGSLMRNLLMLGKIISMLNEISKCCIEKKDYEELDITSLCDENSINDTHLRFLRKEKSLTLHHIKMMNEIMNILPEVSSRQVPNM